MNNIQKCYRIGLIHYLSTSIFYLRIFWYSSILRPSGYILAFKRPNFHDPALFWVKGSLKSSFGCYESILGSTNFFICNLAFPATIALKLKNNEIRVLLTPNKPKNTRKCRILTFLALWPLVWPLEPLSAFYPFSEILNT